MRRTLLLLLLTACRPVAAADLPSADDVRANVQRAMADRGAHISGVRCEGRARLSGSDCAYTLVYDSRGRFRAETVGPMFETRGFDGTTCWVHDFSGATRALDLQD